VEIKDRLKDGIKSGGEWISTIELEDVLLEHLAVAEAIVIGVPDPKWEERPLACVTLQEDASATVAELREHVAGRMARWSVPERWAFVEAVPPTSVGKPDKVAVRRAFDAGELNVHLPQTA